MFVNSLEMVGLSVVDLIVPHCIIIIKRDQATRSRSLAHLTLIWALCPMTWRLFLNQNQFSHSLMLQLSVAVKLFSMSWLCFSQPQIASWQAKWNNIAIVLLCFIDVHSSDWWLMPCCKSKHPPSLNLFIRRRFCQQNTYHKIREI